MASGTVDLRDAYRQVIDAISRGDPAALDDLVSVGVVDHNPVPGQSPGIEGFKQWMAAARSTFPDLRGTVEDVVVDRDRVAGRVTWRGTQRGAFAGLEATNRPVSFAAFHFVRFREGRAVEWWGTADLLGALQQLGARVVSG